MTITEFMLYLIYGFAMVTMGIYALMQKQSKFMNLSLVKSLKYLGLFGITHGMSEWISMIIRLELCHPLYHHDFIYGNQILKAVSFTFLFYFGFDFLPIRDRYKKILLGLPVLFLIAYVGGFFFLLNQYGMEYHLTNPKYNIISLRYLMGFPSCLISAAALWYNARIIAKTRSIEISKRYKNLAWVFIFYSLLEGLLVSKADYFPANIINKELFIELFQITPLMIKAFVGFIIYVLLIKVIDTFSWEQEERLGRLEKHRIASEERRKLGLELHDSIIQELYAVGLKIEYLSYGGNPDKTNSVLDEVKHDLGNAICKVREFISSSTLDKIQCEDLKDNIGQLVQKFNQSQPIKINLHCKISPYTSGYITPEKSTQIYYIVQEALSNVIKHSQANYANVQIEGRHDFLYVTVIDNGNGIQLDKIDPQKQFGISSMKDRAEHIRGTLTIDKIIDGTRIELKIPWEESEHEQ